MLSYLQGLKFDEKLRVLRTVRKCHVQYNSHSRDARCVLPRLPRVRSAAVTRCCLLNLLTFDEFERVMHAVKRCFGNTKTLGNNVGYSN